MLFYAILAAIFAWLVALTFSIFRSKRQFHHLVSGTKHQKIDEILDRLLYDDDRFAHLTKELKEELTKLEKKTTQHIQKVGVARFDPFDKASNSDQSFVLALLNSYNTGVVINFVQTHEGMRAYCKHVEAGKGKEYPLSTEEQRAIDLSS